ncbi:MAG: IPT/TIG domain-containing protein, partial [Terracidiphilus sp.]
MRRLVLGRYIWAVNVLFAVFISIVMIANTGCAKFTWRTSSAPLPTVASFQPASGPVGTSVIVTGTNLTGATLVAFNGSAATPFTVNSATQVTATVPSGATSGKISVTTPGGTATSTGDFTVTATVVPPTVASFSPTSGAIGTTVTITGTNLTGATAVAFNGTTATFAVNSVTQITANVPSGATSGKISVTTPGGVATSTGDFTVTATVAPPTVTSFSPTSGAIGTTVTITGTNLTGATAVAFNGTTATFVVNSATQITATVPSSATTGKISVTTPGGVATSASNFTVTAAVAIAISPTNVTLQPNGPQQFTATVTGSSNTAVTWTATGGTISSSGLYVAASTTGNFAVTATAAADTSKTATASVTIATGTTGLPPIPRMSDGPYVVIQSPASGMHFFAPGTIRIYADPFDPNAADPDTITVTYLVNGQAVGTFTGTDAQNGTYPFTVTNLAAGTYVITGQITASGKVVTSAPVTVFVDNLPATSGQVYNLAANATLSGSQTATYSGTAANPCLINGNGFQITSASGFTGSLNISNCIVRNLGTANNPSINVSVNGSGSIQLSNNIFETFGTVSVATSNQGQIVVRGNEFRENTLVPVTHLPIEYGGETLPVFQASGTSSAQQYFQGNNVGLSTVYFQNTQNWLIGGNSDADSNIMIGVRCGFTVDGSTNMVLRGNYSQHNYPHRMSQGNNFQLDGDGFLVEHNIIRSSSWPVRGMGGELRYNLIDASGNSDEIIGGPMSNVNIHHNVIDFTVSQTLYSPGTGLYLLYSVDGVQFHNNTMDGGGTYMDFAGSPVSATSGAFIGSLRNNVFYNFAASAGAPILTGAQGESTTPPPARLRYSDYNDFYNPDAPNQTNYGLSVVGLTAGSAGYGMHDLGGVSGHVNPKFTQSTV